MSGWKWAEKRQGGPPVDVADHRDRRTDMDDVGFPHEHFLGFLAYFPQQRLV